MQASNLSYNADGLIPCIVQDADTRKFNDGMDE